MEKLLLRNWRRGLWKEIKGPEVLEIGVGTGKNIPFYPEEIELTGIDISGNMLKRAKKLLAKQQKNGVKLKQMDAQQMGFPDESFDEVAGTFVFCSVSDPVLGLKEALQLRMVPVFSGLKVTATQQ